MSMFENNQYRWRETYFVLFPSKNRPTLKQIHKAITGLNQHLTLTNLVANSQGRLESLTVLAPEDFSALDISYLSGEEGKEQVVTLAEEVAPTCCCEDETQRLELLRKCDARLDILHFEQIVDTDEDGDETFDPSSLLLVLEKLAELTGGISVDPQGGAML